MAMQKSYLVLKKAIESAGVKAVSAQMNLSQSLIYKWCQDSEECDEVIQASGAANPLDRLQKIYEVTQDESMIAWACEMADGYFVKNPPKGKGSVDVNILKNIQRFIKEFSEALDVISESYNRGKRITEQEAKKIRKEWEDLKRVGEGFVGACESGKFNK